MSERLKNKVVIITGAASGMGKAIAELFARQGAKIIAGDLNEDCVKSVVEKIKQAGGEAIAVKANVANQADIDNLFSSAENSFHGLDILVNNAGIMDNMEPVANVTDSEWERVFSVNTVSVMRTSRIAVKLFLPKKHGVILNIASVGGIQGARAGAAYTASKHAVVGLTKNTAYMYEKEGIRCNAIAPGGINTNISSSMTNIDKFGMQRQQTGMTTMPEPGSAEDIANAALFLVSDEAAYVNGAVLPVDGAWTAY
ncbi:3-ketoacyl-ACP reductase [Oenococcus oeni]|uniref:SDR family oxidoreductase n=1 Tax=Oenococcus oeni TaxID=1247 RepID=UPI0008F8F1BC|nr:SDR family oxidoreductase [Oenococcus oeni]OIK86753.1 3-ketoacyl-ACP reductase [Oenococcus oeni]OIL09146.1 3-ketoacyl-ACP reductase [Oenococcus oeni]OIL14230.1 3-ketoacyl-ACP reductase [Oenococcus oeni]